RRLPDHFAEAVIANARYQAVVRIDWRHRRARILNRARFLLRQRTNAGGRDRLNEISCLIEIVQCEMIVFWDRLVAKRLLVLRSKAAIVIGLLRVRLEP